VSVSVERRLVLVDETDGTDLTVEWDPDKEPGNRFIITATDPSEDAVKLYVSPNDLLAFAKLIQDVYGTHDPF
jgi:hypothetical protein